jgi:septal ring factor EnvC (AmiA/AmiB activator)
MPRLDAQTTGVKDNDWQSLRIGLNQLTKRLASLETQVISQANQIVVLQQQIATLQQQLRQVR